jgi:inner membrane protein YidH
MIERYSDHAANERTFLAWVRTAIAVMAFGFLIEKFDIFLSYIATQAQAAPLRGQKLANEAGVAFILLGIAMIVVAALRFFRTAKDIDKPEVVPGSGFRLDLTLAGLLFLLGLSLFLYMSRAVVPTF